MRVVDICALCIFVCWLAKDTADYFPAVQRESCTLLSRRSHFSVVALQVFNSADAPSICKQLASWQLRSVFIECLHSNQPIEPYLSWLVHCVTYELLISSCTADAAYIDCMYALRSNARTQSDRQFGNLPTRLISLCALGRACIDQVYSGCRRSVNAMCALEFERGARRMQNRPDAASTASSAAASNLSITVLCSTAAAQQ